MKETARRQDGFTLVEVLMATSAGLVVLTALVTMLTVTARWGGDVQESSVHQTEARAVLDELARELRQAYTGDSTSAIQSIGQTQIVFTSPDRLTPFHLRRIAYRLVNGRFERSVTTSTNTGGPPWTYPAQGLWIGRVDRILNALAFTYVDAGGVPTVDPAAVKTATVTLQVRAGSGQGTTTTYQGSATLRAATP